MWKIPRVFFLAGLLLLVSTVVFSQTKPPKKVLFVGNSYTYFGNLTQMIKALAFESGYQIDIKESTAGGANLGHHWNGEKNLKTTELIKDMNYDAVVLQDQSLRAIEAPDRLIYYGKLLGELTKSHQGIPFLFMTWARKRGPDMLSDIKTTYGKLATLLDAPLVPVGLAWHRAQDLNPDIQLYHEDGSHPSLTGTYLTACVFYVVFTNQSPIGLPSRLLIQESNGKKLQLNIPVSDATFCQEIAHEFFVKFNKR